VRVFDTIARRARGWPRAGQIGIAIVAGIAVALAAGAISTGHGSGRAVGPTSSTPRPATSLVGSSSTPRPATSRAGSSSTSVVRTTSDPSSTVRSTTAPPETAPPTTRPVAPAAGWVPLAIAAPSHEDTYSRTADFGGWLDVFGCQDTRATLLIRRSQVPVTFTTASDCTVKTGRWVDPWSGATATVAHDLQVDHTVPLANAWRSGAWSWTRAQRVAYANDLGDVDHLVPILAGENESKGDDGPEGWRPPSRSAWCRYALDWDRIKAKWHLSATPAEWAALGEMRATC
jgi:hypothetical protein